MNVFDLPIHPQADIYPMLPKDEMEELALRIKQEGLHHPIVVGDYEGKIHIIDGRNRREACRIAGIEPRYEMINGTDPVDLIASSNLARRHMTKSQRAMAMAMHYPESPKGRGNKNPNNLGFSSESLRQARKVLRLNPLDAGEVLAGSIMLADAYKDVQVKEKEANSNEARIASLRDNYPDLASNVDDGTLTLEGAEAEAEQRDINARKAREDKMESLYKFHVVANVIRNDSHLKSVKELFDSHSNDFTNYTRKPLAEFLSDIETVEKNIGSLKSIIQEKVNGNA